ncbi:MAG: NTP transferase domain-containing protein [Candidatus Peregrinibacteria bacterium]
MKVLVLAAGRSNRMKPVRDKNFLNFMGRPLIRRQIEALESAGFVDLILVGGAHNLGELGEVAREVQGVNVELVEQKDLEQGMCGAILAAKDLIKDGEIMVFSSNDVVDQTAFELVMQAAKDEDADSYILGKKVSEYFPGGYLETDENGFLKSIIEKPEPGTEPSDMVNLVVHLHKNSGKLIEALENVKSKNDDLYEVALGELLKNGMKMKAVAYNGFWQPIKYPWHIQKVFRYLFEKTGENISPSAKIADSAVIKGPVVIGENVKILDGAVINGPVYIGDNSVIATNALVRESHVGENCVIGFGSEIARSYLGNNVWTHTNYVGDSVIGSNVSFGAGTVTGNLRLDEKNIFMNCDGKKVDTQSAKFGLVTGDDIRVGVNTSFMPGVKIGGGSFIGAGIVVGEDIEEDSFVRGKFELKISKNKEKADPRT